MIDHLILGLTAALQVKQFLFMVLGTVIGLWVGVLPGLGGPVAMAILIPFTFSMDTILGSPAWSGRSASFVPPAVAALDIPNRASATDHPAMKWISMTMNRSSSSRSSRGH